MSQGDQGDQGDHDDLDDAANVRRRQALIAGGAIILLMVVGFVLARTLWSSARLQDCLMSGRTNCAPIEVTR
jgi:hypothetical protein